MAGGKTMSAIMASELRDYCAAIRLRNNKKVYELSSLPLPDFGGTMLPTRYADAQNLVSIHGITAEYFSGLNKTLGFAYTPKEKEKIFVGKVYSDGSHQTDKDGKLKMESFEIPRGSFRLETDVKLKIPHSIDGVIVKHPVGFIRGDATQDKKTGAWTYTYIIPYENATKINDDNLMALVLTRNTQVAKSYTFGASLLLTDGTTVYLYVTSTKNAIRNQNRIIGLKTKGNFITEIKLLVTFFMYAGIMFPVHLLNLEKPIDDKTNLAFNVLCAKNEEA